jgi:hypothetical protein
VPQFTSPSSKVFLGAVVFLVAFGVLASVQEASAAPQKKPLKEPQSVSNHQLHEALHILHSVKKTLEMADHDYGGHRAAAVRDISAAAHQLKLALEHVHKNKKPGTGKPGTGSKGTPNREPQVLSDKQLADAIPTLNATIALLQKADHDYGGHRARAVTDLQVAIKQLEKALKWSAEHNKNKP